jgi:predicted small secreted protein
MKRLFVPAIVAASLSLAGCATTGGAIDITSLISEVQAGTNAACAFVPTAETVAGIISAGNPIVSTASAIINAICAAVAPTKAGALRRAGAPPTVAGVVVHGKFTK